MSAIFKLEEGESIAWEGKPAPRCYTFRHWRHSIFGVIFLALTCYWQVLGISMAARYDTAWLGWLPIPFLIAGVYFSVGHLLQARLEWNNVYYVITNKRLLAARGISKVRVESVLLTEVSYLKLKLQGEALGTLQIHAGESKRLVLHCLEHPRQATVLLEQAIRNNSAQVGHGHEQSD